MVGPLPDPPPHPEPQWRRAWYEYQAYLSVHTASMRHLEASGVVLDSRLSVEEIRERRTLVAVEIRGRVRCADGVTVEVDKTLQARARPDGRSEVLGIHYSYHAWWERAGVARDLLRYDSAPHPGFDGLHRHVFDPATGREVVVDAVERAALPTLDQVITSAVEWRRTVGTEL